jgi:hypothetical protein
MLVEGNCATKPLRNDLKSIQAAAISLQDDVRNGDTDDIWDGQSAYDGKDLAS